jgi:hypothetical protein
MAALAKLLTLCAGAAGGAAACVATGVLPAPELAPHHTQKPHLKRPAASVLSAPGEEGVSYEPAPPPGPAEPKTSKPKHEAPTPEPAETAEPAEASAGAIEYEPPPPAVEAIAPENASPPPTSGSAAGEFGP